MAETLKDIQLKIANCEITPSAIWKSQPKVTSHHTIVCWKCKQMGHYARGCASNRQKRRWWSPTNKNIYNVPALSVNNVTSYYLQGCVSDVSVSFLVDTGAGVSLLNGHVWDQDGLTSVKMSPAPHSNLVGVDRHPLQVTGIVTNPMTISSTVFIQAFVI